MFSHAFKHVGGWHDSQADVQETFVYVVEHRAVTQLSENRGLAERVLTAIKQPRDWERLPLLQRKGGMSCKEIAQELSITEGLENRLCS